MSRSCFFTILLALGLAACAKRDGVSFIERGDDYFAEKKFREATIAYRNAIQQDPQSVDAHYKLAESYAQLSDIVNALPEYVRAADLRPEFVDAQIKAAHMLLVTRQYDDARVRARAALRADPQNASAMLLLGNSLAGLQSLDEAVAANEKAVALDPARAGMQLNLGALQFARGNRDEAEAAMRKAVELAPDSAESHLGLAGFNWATGRIAEAQEEYRKALALNPTDTKTNRAVAFFFMGSNRPSEAEGYFKAALQSKEARAYQDLADYYASQRRWDDSIQTLTNAPPPINTSVEARTRIAVVHYLAGRRAEARKELDEASIAFPQHAVVLALKAHVLLEERDLNGALEAANAAVAADRRSTRARYAQGKALMAIGDDEEGRKSFIELLKLEPSSAEAKIEISRMHLARNEIDSAIQYAREAVAAAPAYIDAHLALARALMVRDDDFERATQVLSVLMRMAPKEPAVLVAAGGLAQAKGDKAGAERAFTQAVLADPHSIPARRELIVYFLSAGKADAARAQVREALTLMPDSAETLLLAGRTFSVLSDPAAESFLKRAIELDPQSLDAYNTLATFYLSKGRRDDAVGQFQAVADRQPKSAEPRMMLGILADVQGRTDLAEEWYQKTLAIDPRSAPASNNLAWILAERGTSLEMALQLAETANLEMQGKPEFMDTLGWVHFKKGSLDRAIPLFQRCIAKNGNNPIYYYHLGMAYAKNGDDGKARVALNQALKIAPDFPGNEEAKRALRELVY